HVPGRCGCADADGAAGGRVPAAGAAGGDELSAAGDDARWSARSEGLPPPDEPLRGGTGSGVQPGGGTVRPGRDRLPRGRRVLLGPHPRHDRRPSFGSIARVLASSLAFVALVSFLVLMGLAIRANRRKRIPPGQLPPPPSPKPATAEAGGTQASQGLDRRALTGALVGVGSVLGITALGSALDRSYGSGESGGADAGTTGRNGAAVTPSGETTTVAVGMADMRFDPEVLEVPAGNTLVIELSNDDAHDVHDLVLANGVTSGRLQPGESATIEAGTIEHDLEGWCSIVG